jgi:hypothetical protein
MNISRIATPLLTCALIGSTGISLSATAADAPPVPGTIPSSGTIVEKAMEKAGVAGKINGVNKSKLPDVASGAAKGAATGAVKGVKEGGVVSGAVTGAKTGAMDAIKK